MSEKSVTGKQSFAPRARLVSVLGEQLIRDARVGLLELAKNSYDADASCVDVKILNIANPEATEVIVADDGIGMDRQSLLSRWLEPATGHKERAKKADQRTERFGRLPLGEKGVGRFAAQRLGKTLELITRAKGNPELVLRVNWADFENGDPYLHEVMVDWEEREPVAFVGERTGTVMRMVGAKSPWTEEDIRTVSLSLRRLMSPFKPAQNYVVRFKCPEFEKYEDLDPGAILTTSHSTFQGLVDSRGNIEAEYTFHIPGFSPRTEVFNDAIWNETTHRAPNCGGFWFLIHAWHRDASVMALSGTNRKDLDNHFGVSVFRDGLRVLPYGEPDDDWLSLDERRYINPTEAISRKNLVGAIDITQGENGDLHDKTNREGLIENPAFTDFRLLLLEVIKLLENEWSKDRATIEGKKRQDRQPASKPAIAKLKAELNQLKDDTGLTEQAIERVSRALEKGKIEPQAAESLTEAISKLKTSIPTIQEAAVASEERIDQTLLELDDQRDLLLGLAGIGLAAERYTHEFARLTREASDIIKSIRNQNPPKGILSNIEALSAILDALRNDIRALGPMFYVRRSTREKELSIISAIRNAETLNRGAIHNQSVVVNVIGDDFTVVMREGPLTQVFNNLVDNAIFWLGRKSDEQNRKLLIVSRPLDREVVVSDNGPGINPRYRDRVFEPFFSTKTEGRGLGLYIIREILAEKKYRIRLLDPEERGYGQYVPGAAFLLSFPAEVETVSEDDNA